MWSHLCWEWTGSIHTFGTQMQTAMSTSLSSEVQALRDEVRTSAAAHREELRTVVSEMSQMHERQMQQLLKQLQLHGEGSLLPTEGAGVLESRQLSA